MRSPIQRMIDAACGIPDGLPEVNGRDADDAWLLLFCPECGRAIAVERFPEIDPPRATLMVMRCDGKSCDEEGATPDYYDASGRDLGPDDWPDAIRSTPAPTPDPKP